MNYIIRTNSINPVFKNTIDDVIDYIVTNGKNHFFEKDGYLYEFENQNEFIPISDALSKLKMEIFLISDILSQNLIYKGEVFNFHLENNNVLVLTTKNFRTIKLNY